METTLTLLILAILLIIFLLALLFFPYIRNQLSSPSDDSSDMQTQPHPFKFKKSPDSPINDKIVESVFQMGGFGDTAEEDYQARLDSLRSVAADAVPIIVDEYNDLPEDQYVDRWSLVQLLTDLAHPSSLGGLDNIVSTSIPPEKSRDQHNFSTRAEETILRTTAIEAITRVAASNNKEAIELLLKHSRNDSFSIKRASVQGYLEVGGEKARDVLTKEFPKNDHYILDIRREDVRKVPQADLDKREMRDKPIDVPKATTSKPTMAKDTKVLT